eukprot:scaffold5.g742.t1
MDGEEPPRAMELEGGPGTDAPQPPLHQGSASTASLHVHLPLSPVVLAPAGSGGRSAPDSPLATPFGAAALDEAAADDPAADAASADPPADGGSGTAAPAEAAATAPLAALEREHSFLLRDVKRSGVRVYAWGRGDCGQLGLGSSEDVGQPRCVEGLLGKDVVDAAAGAFHTAAVTSEGELYVAGSNDSGQLGVKGEEQVLVPTRVGALENYQVDLVSCGAAHTVAVTDAGVVVACGLAEYGQLGLGPGAGASVDHPRMVRALKGARVVRVAVGGNHTLALGADGCVWSAGDDSFGALGRGGGAADVPRPVLPLWPLGIVMVAAGDNHSAALTLDGRLLTWGRGKHGQLGLGDFENRSQPTLVKALAGVPLRQGDICYPKLVAGLEGRHIVQVAAGGRHTLALAEDSSLWAFGDNECLQLATGGGARGEGGGGGAEGGGGGGGGGFCAAPRRVRGLPPLPVLFAVAGGDHSLAVMQQPLAGEAIAPGPSRSPPHGQAYLPVPLPSLQRAIAAAGAGGREDRRALAAVTAAVECIFSSPAFLVAAMSPAGLAAHPTQRDGSPGATATAAATAAAAAAAAASTPAAMEVDARGAAAGGGGGEADASGTTGTRRSAAAAAAATAAATAAAQEPDAAVVGAAYAGLLNLFDLDPGVVSALSSSCVRLLEALEHHVLSAPPGSQGGGGAAAAGKAPRAAAPGGAGAAADLSWIAPVLFVLLQNPLNGEPEGVGGQILMQISRLLAATLSGEARLAVRRGLQALLRRLPAEVLGGRCVRPLQRYIGSLVRGAPAAARVQLLMAGVLLDVLREANEEAGEPIPYSEFANRELSEAANLQAEYVAWRQHAHTQALASLCQVPFLLTPEAKARILAGEASMQKQQQLNQAAMQLLTRDLFNAAFGMFAYSELTRTYWFSQASLESATEYALVGAAVGLAIYNGERVGGALSSP